MSASLARARSRLRVRRLVDPVHGAAPPAHELGGHQLVGHDHQFLDERVRPGLAFPGGAGDAAAVDVDDELAGIDGERPALEAPRPQLPRDAVGQDQLLAGHGCRVRPSSRAWPSPYVSRARLRMSER